MIKILSLPRAKLVALNLALVAQLSGCSSRTTVDESQKGGAIGSGNGAIIGEAVSPGVAAPVDDAAIGAFGGTIVGREEEPEKKRK
jgi:osmotically inducible lipoprotein OsmB